MAEKEQQSAYPARNGNTEAATAAAAHDATRAQRKKKRNKCILYILLFIVFQTAIITVFALTIMKVRTPRFRIRSAAITNFNAGTAASPSLQATITPEFTVKNANFGRYKYRNTTVEFFYRGTRVGQVSVLNSKTGWRSTKRFTHSAVELNISGSPQLAEDLRAGVVPITSTARMGGKVELIFIMKKNKATNMNCTMNIVTASPQSFSNILCR
ncbi:hypothetical protein SASPL_127896 [Salvia splendens]|uniref:Late embryogenesis abundant protein LEA-2 subgroup domain-containing protein n=1 Tax=Salvia splendens TaxID=180675 RepID=A0A8X8XC15_SALSN|nr:uncharacterized protein LOC121751816 [Salvia splendens]KAG6409854.1 hypothetical protein SASPL_127896 [Salvia splendens]